MANELPTLETLQGTYGAWNPQAYDQAKANQGLASMYQQENLNQNRLKTVADQQAIDQTTLMNPLRVQQLQGTNKAQDYTNQASALKLERDQALQPYNLAQDQKDAIYKMTDSDLKAAQQHGEVLMQDPATYEQGLKIIQASKDFYLAKQTHDRALALENLKGQYHLKGAQIGANATLGAAQIGADSRIEQARIAAERALEAKQMSQTLNQYLVTLNKLPPSPERDAQIANVTQQLQMANPGYGTAIDTGAMGIPRNAQSAAPPVAAGGGTHTFSDLKAMYPNKSDAELRAAYKRKFGVDPQ